VTYFMYQSPSQAERPRSRAEQQEIDRANGELAAAFSQLGHSVATPWRSLRRALRGGQARRLMSARQAPRRGAAARVDGVVPRVAKPDDYAMACSLASFSPDCTR
jgi:hypothetical protein